VGFLVVGLTPAGIVSTRLRQGLPSFANLDRDPLSTCIQVIGRIKSYTI